MSPNRNALGQRSRKRNEDMFQTQGICRISYFKKKIDIYTVKCFCKFLIQPSSVIPAVEGFSACSKKHKKYVGLQRKVKLQNTKCKTV